MSKNKDSGSWLRWGDNEVDNAPQREQVQVVPGSPGFTVCNLIRLLSQGNNFFRNVRDKNGSNVFQLNLKENRVVLCSHESIECMYTSPHVSKQHGFGMLHFNANILNDHIPMIFENGELHNERRKIVIELLKMLFCKENLLKDLFELVENELMKMTADNQTGLLDHFEKTISNCVFDIFATFLFGVKLDNKMIAVWMDNCLSRKKNDRGKDEAVNAGCVLKDAIKQSPKFQMIMNNIKSSDIQVTQEEVTNELLFLFIFNGGTALGILTISMAIMLKKLTAIDINLLETEYQNLIDGDYQMDTFKAMVNIESFVLETLRLFPPAPAVFARAKEDFVLSIKSGRFQIKKGALLNGNIYLSNRDPERFENPDQFDFQRFQKNSNLRNFLTTFGVLNGTTEEILPHERACPGPNIAMIIGKTILCHLLNAKYEFSKNTNFSGNNLTRAMASDKPVCVKSFQFNVPPKQ